MARGAWELAAGARGARDTGLAALFRGASLLRQDGESTSVITALKDCTVLLYFAANWNEACKSFNTYLKMFYDIICDSGDDSIVVIFVSNDESREEQVKFFNDDSMHPNWFCVEWTYDLQDLLRKFEVTLIPSLLVVDQRGRAVVSDAREAILEVFGEGGGPREPRDAEELALERWAAWRRLAGDWRASAGRALGGGEPAAPAAAPASAAPAAAAPTAAPPAGRAPRGPSPAPAAGAWACGACTLDNAPRARACAACGAAAPAAAAAPAPAAPAAAPGPGAAAEGREAMRARRLAALEERLASGSDVAAAAFGAPAEPPGRGAPGAGARAPRGLGPAEEAEAVRGLVGTGFREERARAALRRAGGDLEAAVSELVADV